MAVPRRAAQGLSNPRPGWFPARPERPSSCAGDQGRLAHADDQPRRADPHRARGRRLPRLVAASARAHRRAEHRPDEPRRLLPQLPGRWYREAAEARGVELPDRRRARSSTACRTTSGRQAPEGGHGRAEGRVPARRAGISTETREATMARGDRGAADGARARIVLVGDDGARSATATTGAACRRPGRSPWCGRATTEQVAAALRVCHAHRQPVVPQGGLTGLCGGARPATGGVALSLERMVGDRGDRPRHRHHDRAAPARRWRRCSRRPTTPASSSRSTSARAAPARSAATSRPTPAATA